MVQARVLGGSRLAALPAMSPRTTACLVPRVAARSATTAQRVVACNTPIATTCVTALIAAVLIGRCMAVTLIGPTSKGNGGRAGAGLVCTRCYKVALVSQGYLCCWAPSLHLVVRV